MEKEKLPFLSLLVIEENFSAHKVSNEILTELRPSDTRLDNWDFKIKPDNKKQ